MTLIPETRKYPLTIWTREPVRKIRMMPVTLQELNDLQRVFGNATEIHGATKAGSYVVIPASNIAYVEVLELGKDLTSEES